MNEKQNIPTEPEDFIPYYRRIIHKFIKDFVEEMERQGKKAIEMGRPVPTLIRNVDDLIKLCELDMSLSEMLPAKGKTTSYLHEEDLEEQIANDEKTKRLLRSLYQRTITSRNERKKVLA